VTSISQLQVRCFLLGPFGIEKTFDTTWQFGLIYKLLELKFVMSLIKLIASFLTDRKFKAWVQGDFPTSRDIAGGDL
jgi:hypothetical protein